MNLTSKQVRQISRHQKVPQRNKSRRKMIQASERHSKIVWLNLASAIIFHPTGV